MSYRNFSNVELKAIQRFSVHIFQQYNVEMKNWKIDYEGNLTIKLFFETNDYQFEDYIYVSKQNRMEIKKLVKEFKQDCLNHISNLSNPFEEEIDYDLIDEDHFDSDVNIYGE